MTYDDFKKALKQKKFANAYFFCGDEDYLIEQGVSQLIEAKVDPASRDFNLDILYGQDVEGGKILDIANAYPMMAECRMLVVKGIDALSQTTLDNIARFLEKPSSTTVLVMTSKKVDFRKKAFTAIKERTCFVESKPLYDSQVPAWIRDHVRERGYEISQEAIMLLQARVGANLRGIVSEIDKILLNLNGRNQIEVDDVNKCVGLSRNFSVFDLTNTIGQRDLNRALLILNRMLELGESPIGILTMITRHFINVVKIKEAVKQRMPPNKLMSLTGIPPYFQEEAKRMARDVSHVELERIFEQLRETDLILKTSQQPPRIALESLIIQVIRG